MISRRGCEDFFDRSPTSARPCFSRFSRAARRGSCRLHPPRRTHWESRMATATGARPASAFQSSAFSRFYAGQALSYLGDGLRTLAIPLLVFHFTGSATAIGVTWGLELAPYAFVSMIAGSLADRIDRRR